MEGDSVNGQMHAPQEWLDQVLTRGLQSIPSAAIVIWCVRDLLLCMSR